MGLIKKLYFIIGEKLGYIEANGLYEFKGISADGNQILQRIGYRYMTVNAEVMLEPETKK